MSIPKYVPGLRLSSQKMENKHEPKKHPRPLGWVETDCKARSDCKVRAGYTKGIAETCAQRVRDGNWPCMQMVGDGLVTRDCPFR